MKLKDYVLEELTNQIIKDLIHEIRFGASDYMGIIAKEIVECNDVEKLNDLRQRYEKYKKYTDHNLKLSDCDLCEVEDDILHIIDMKSSLCGLIRGSIRNILINK